MRIVQKALEGNAATQHRTATSSLWCRRSLGTSLDKARPGEKAVGELDGGHCRSGRWAWGADEHGVGSRKTQARALACRAEGLDSGMAW